MNLITLMLIMLLSGIVSVLLGKFYNFSFEGTALMFGILYFGLVNYVQTNAQRKKLQKHIEHLTLLLEKSQSHNHTDTGTFVPLKEIEKNIGKEKKEVEE